MLKVAVEAQLEETAEACTKLEMHRAMRGDITEMKKLDVELTMAEAELSEQIDRLPMSYQVRESLRAFQETPVPAVPPPEARAFLTQAQFRTEYEGKKADVEGTYGRRK